MGLWKQRSRGSSDLSGAFQARVSPPRRLRLNGRGLPFVCEARRGWRALTSASNTCRNQCLNTQLWHQNKDGATFLGPAERVQAPTPGSRRHVRVYRCLVSRSAHKGRLCATQRSEEQHAAKHLTRARMFPTGNGFVTEAQGLRYTSAQVVVMCVVSWGFQYRSQQCLNSVFS